MKGPPSFELNAIEGVATPIVSITAVAAAAASFEILFVISVILLTL